MGNYENSTEVGRGEGLTEGELRTMGALAVEATEKLRKTTVRKETVLLGSVPFGSWDEFAKAVQEMAAHSYEPIPVEEMGYDVPFNTTLSCLITNAKLSKTQANKLASILHDGFARAIKPVHGTLDGDAIFVMTTNQVEVNFDAFAALATDILQYSVIDGALAATDAYGLKASRSIISK